MTELLVESIAILLILAIMAVLFLRSHRQDYAILMIPVFLVPLIHTIVAILGEFFRFATHTNFRAFSDVLALAAAVAVMGMLSGKAKSKRTKYAYLLLYGGFSTALTLIYLYHIYLPA